MIEQLPTWIPLLFLVTTVITLVLFYYSNGKPKRLLSILVLWGIVHSILAYNEFYRVTDTIPPRFALVMVPVFATITYGLFPKQLRWVYANRNLKISTFLHTIRIPVEIVLLYLYLHHTIPELMTFEGYNFDILAGITAPIVGVLFIKKKFSKKSLLVWNVIGLFLICCIFLIATLSAELPFQQLAFDQPNRGITYFPFILLPALVAPIVLYMHLSDILKLRQEIGAIKSD